MKNSHPLIEDVYALFTSVIAFSLGVFLFSEAELLAGGLTGIALLLTHATDLSFGMLFFIVNLPFYALAIMRMGKRFTINTLIAVVLASYLVDHLNYAITLNGLHPVYASITGGILVGIGILVLARHNASSGGLNVLVFYLQERFGVSAGYIQMAIDCTIILCGLLLVPLEQVAISIIGVVVINLTLAFNHKPGRYATS